MSLTEQLAKQRDASRNRIPPDKLAVMDKAGQDLANSGLVDSSLTEGDTIPDFSLPNAVGKIVSISEILKQGPVVLSFYRGGW
ncbi:hypothetical protein ACFL2Q_08875 [Thermodesulfobacteriota bacterium]